MQSGVMVSAVMLSVMAPYTWYNTVYADGPSSSSYNILLKLEILSMLARDIE